MFCFYTHLFFSLFRDDLNLISVGWSFLLGQFSHRDDAMLKKVASWPEARWQLFVVSGPMVTTLPRTSFLRRLLLTKTHEPMEWLGTARVGSWFGLIFFDV